MARARRLALIAASAALAVGSLALAGCGGDDDSGSATNGGDAAGLSGDIRADGSSTVAPLTSAAAEAFAGENGGVNITVGTSGTGGGFERFCGGETDISDASREIEDEEEAACQKAGITYEEFRVASDGITIVTGASADVGGDALTSAQLKAVWSPGSKITNWKDIPGGGFNDVPLTLAGPGSQSGTYDFLNEEILGENAAGDTIEPRQDYSASEDDNVTVRAVAGTEGGMGHFGHAYFEENVDQLRDFSLDGVKPSPETIADGTCPLSRPLLIDVRTDSLAAGGRGVRPVLHRERDPPGRGAEVHPGPAVLAGRGSRQVGPARRRVHGGWVGPGRWRSHRTHRASRRACAAVAVAPSSRACSCSSGRRRSSPS